MLLLHVVLRGFHLGIHKRLIDILYLYYGSIPERILQLHDRTDLERWENDANLNRCRFLCRTELREAQHHQKENTTLVI